mmetsp:Transcript_30056/g.54808  ORF Transcript_30056/g.54808 Transcript_30056/m.54808 type:complete len:142 (+) Transcript_30056:69-494(+)
MIMLTIRLIKRVLKAISDKKHEQASWGSGRMDVRNVDAAVMDILGRCQIPAAPGVGQHATSACGIMSPTVNQEQFYQIVLKSIELSCVHDFDTRQVNMANFPEVPLTQEQRTTPLLSQGMPQARWPIMPHSVCSQARAHPW